MREGDFEVTEIGKNSSFDPFDLYRCESSGLGKGWRYQRSFASEEEVQAFVKENKLTLHKTGTRGIWPMRIYRPSEKRPVKVLPENERLPEHLEPDQESRF
jgi:hypothetical protein